MAAASFKIAGACGIAAPLVAYGSIALSVAVSPWFDWSRGALSDLGARGPSAPIFNSGLVVAGALAAILALGLWRVSEERALQRACSLLLLAASASLCAIGLFPETAGPPHFHASVAFFTLVPLWLASLSSALAKEGRRGAGALAAMSAAAAALVWLYPWSGVAIPETLSSLVASAWIAWVGLRLCSTGAL